MAYITDDDELDLSEEQEDFSASEDEWVPEKNYKKTTSEDEDEDTDEQIIKEVQQYSSKNKNK